MLIFRKNRSIYHLIWSIVFKNDILLRHHNEKQFFFHGSILKSARRDWYKLDRIPKHIDYTIIPNAFDVILLVYNILVSVFPKHHIRLYPWVTVVLHAEIDINFKEYPNTSIIPLFQILLMPFYMFTTY